MKKRLALVSLFMIFSLMLFAAIDASSVENFTIKNQNAQQIKLHFSVDQFDIAEETIEGETYQSLEHPNAGYITKRGNPEIPVFSTFIKIPNQGKVKISTEDYAEVRYQDLNLYPSQGTYEADRGAVQFAKNDDIYSQNKFIEFETAKVSSPVIMRDHRVVSVTVSPLRYNPVTKESFLKKEIDVTIDFIDEPGENEIYRSSNLKSRSFEELYQNTILNYEPTRDGEYQAQTLVIVYNGGDTDVDNIVHHLHEWKREKGYNVVLADTDVIGNSSTAIKTFIQDGYDTWENRPEFILLVGDPQNGSFSVAASGTNGDHHYTELEGTDYLPDAFVGRLSAETTSDLMTIWNKIKFYEKQPYMAELDWYRTNLLVGDSASSGTSTYYTNLYIHDVMSDYDPEHTFIEQYNGSPDVNEMNSAMTDGTLVFNYRGYIGMSGWDVDDINTIQNGHKLVNSIIITCSTGTFVSGTSRTEAFVRAGTPNALRGAVSSIGMATSGTNTRFNNALNGGIFHSLYKDDISRLGIATAYAKVYLHQTYWWDSNHGGPAAFVTWFNQMGDPSMYVWKTQPQPLIATYNSEVEKGTNYLDVHVTKVSGVPIEGAWVTARQVDETGYEEILFSTGYTDASGDVRLDFEGDVPGNVKLTVTNPQYVPHLGSFTIQENEMINIENVVIDDADGGNDNGEVNAGETINFVIELKNYLATDVNNVQAELTTDDPYFEVVSEVQDFGNIVSEDTSSAAFEVNISYACPDNYRGSFTLNIDSDEGEYNNAVFIDVLGTDLEITEMTLDDSGDNILDPGEIANIVLEVVNNGNVDLEDVYAELISNNGLLLVNDNISQFGDIAMGATVDNQFNSFQIQAHAQLIPGMTITFDARFYNSAGYDEVESFEIMIGQPDINDPTGPDEYGYFIYDDEDVDYLDCPTYEWIELDPDLGGSGIDTEMTDLAEDDDKHVSVNLPFTFNFYGEPRTEIVICTNGWVSFSDTDQSTFRNWILPGPLGPTRMIAAFWDDLQTSSSGEGGIFYQYLQEQHAFVISWNQMESRQSGAENTFQIILYDPNFYPTSLDDGKFKIQYKVVNNDDSSGGGPLYTGGNYCTVGIENATSDVGLQYTFSNEYDPNAKPLQNEMAIAFSGPPVSYETAYLVLGDQIVVDDNNNGIVEAGEHIQMGVRLSNIGEQDAIGASATLIAMSPHATVTNAESEYGPINGGQSLAGYDYFEFDVSESIPDDASIDFQLDVTLGEESWQYFFNVTARKAALQYDTFVINDTDGNGDGIPNNGETVQVGLVLENPNMVTAYDVNASVTTDSEIATITGGELEFGSILGESRKMKIFELAIDESAEDSTPIEMTLSYSGTGLEMPNETLSIQVNMSSLFNDFEEDNGEYTGEGSWAWGNYADAYSGTNVWATNIAGNYGSGSNMRLTSPTFLLSGAADLSFWHWYHIENSWDGGQVQISTDNGNTWELLNPSNTEYTGTANSSNPLDGPIFCGSTDDWEEVTFDLSDYVGEEVQLGWIFGSDGSVQYEGWYIDDVLIGGVSADFGGLVSGNVTLTDEEFDIQDVAITTSADISTSPDAEGNFTLILPEGNNNVGAFLPYHTSDVYDSLAVSMLTPLTGIDFVMDYLVAPENLIFETDDYIASLDWDFTNADDEDFIGFNIYRRIDTDQFIQVGNSTEPHFEQTLTNNHTFAYYVEAEYANGVSDRSNEVSFFLFVDNEEDDVAPLVTALNNNYPNPFNPTTNISFSLAEASDVKIVVFNIKGQIVKTLKNEHMEAGNYNVVWNGKDDFNKNVSTGVYFYKMETNKYHKIKKALLLK